MPSAVAPEIEHTAAFVNAVAGIADNQQQRIVQRIADAFGQIGIGP